MYMKVVGNKVIGRNSWGLSMTMNETDSRVTNLFYSMKFRNVF